MIDKDERPEVYEILDQIRPHHRQRAEAVRVLFHQLMIIPPGEDPLRFDEVPETAWIPINALTKSLAAINNPDTASEEAVRNLLKVGFDLRIAEIFVDPVVQNLLNEVRERRNLSQKDIPVIAALLQDMIWQDPQLLPLFSRMLDGVEADWSMTAKQAPRKAKGKGKGKANAHTRVASPKEMLLDSVTTRIYGIEGASVLSYFSQLRTLYQKLPAQYTADERRFALHEYVRVHKWCEAYLCAAIVEDEQTKVLLRGMIEASLGMLQTAEERSIFMNDLLTAAGRTWGEQTIPVDLRTDLLHDVMQLHIYNPQYYRSEQFAQQCKQEEETLDGQSHVRLASQLIRYCFLRWCEYNYKNQDNGQASLPPEFVNRVMRDSNVQQLIQTAESNGALLREDRISEITASMQNDTSVMKTLATGRSVEAVYQAAQTMLAYTSYTEPVFQLLDASYLPDGALLVFTRMYDGSKSSEEHNNIDRLYADRLRELIREAWRQPQIPTEVEPVLKWNLRYLIDAPRGDRNESTEQIRNECLALGDKITAEQQRSVSFDGDLIRVTNPQYAPLIEEVQFIARLGRGQSHMIDVTIRFKDQNRMVALTLEHTKKSGYELRTVDGVIIAGLDRRYPSQYEYLWWLRMTLGYLDLVCCSPSEQTEGSSAVTNATPLNDTARRRGMRWHRMRLQEGHSPRDSQRVIAQVFAELNIDELNAQRAASMGEDYDDRQITVAMPGLREAIGYLISDEGGLSGDFGAERRSVPSLLNKSRLTVAEQHELQAALLRMYDEIIAYLVDPAARGQNPVIWHEVPPDAA